MGFCCSVSETRAFGLRLSGRSRSNVVVLVISQGTIFVHHIIERFGFAIRLSFRTASFFEFAASLQELLSDLATAFDRFGGFVFAG